MGTATDYATCRRGKLRHVAKRRDRPLPPCGKAQKAQVQDMVQRLLKLSGLPGTDAADALGVAICHAHSGGEPVISVLTGGALARKTESMTQEEIFTFLDRTIGQVPLRLPKDAPPDLSTLDAETNRYVAFGPRRREGTINMYSLFAQDSWRTTPTLTLNAGLRWDLQLPFTAVNDTMSAVTMESICGTSGLGDGGQYSKCNVLQPGAGISPEDVSVAEVYDLSTALELTIGTNPYAADTDGDGTPFIAGAEPHKCERWEWHPWSRLPEPLFTPSTKAELGSHDELIVRDGLYAELYQMQARAYA